MTTITDKKILKNIAKNSYYSIEQFEAEGLEAIKAFEEFDKENGEFEEDFYILEKYTTKN